MVLIGLGGAGALGLKTFEVANPEDLFLTSAERSRCPVWRWASNIYMVNFFTVLVSALTGAPYVNMDTTGSQQPVFGYLVALLIYPCQWFSRWVAVSDKHSFESLLNF